MFEVVGKNVTDGGEWNGLDLGVDKVQYNTT